MKVTDRERALLADVLNEYRAAGKFPNTKSFRVKHEADRENIDLLISRNFLRKDNDSLQLTLKGLNEADSPEARELLERCNKLIPILKDAYRKRLDGEWSVEQLADLAAWKADEVAEALFFLKDISFWSGFSPGTNGRARSIALNEEILNIVSVEATLLKWEEPRAQSREILINDDGILDLFPGVGMSRNPYSSRVRGIPLEISLLHVEVQKVAAKLVEDGHYRQAITDAFILVDNYVQKQSGAVENGAPLMNKVFSAKNPILKLSDHEEEQVGFMQLFSGAMKAVRNQYTHKLVDPQTKEETLEWLGFASALLRLVDGATYMDSELPRPKSAPGEKIL